MVRARSVEWAENPSGAAIPNVGQDGILSYKVRKPKSSSVIGNAGISREAVLDRVLAFGKKQSGTA